MLLGSCSVAKKDVPTKQYYAGEFVYFADAASIVDCATGVRTPVSNDGEYLEAERQYSSLGAHGQPVLVEFFGHRTIQKSMEGDRNETALVIDTLIGFDHGALCNPTAMVVGIYEGTTPKGKYLLRLKSDYTYTQSIFVKNDGEVISSGVWYLCSQAEMVLRQELPVAEASTFEIVPAQEALVKNSGGKPLVLVKVYLH